MEFRQLRYFVSIADLGSVSRASRALGHGPQGILNPGKVVRMAGH